MSNELGNVRQSAVIMNYGPGAILDFRVPVTGAAVSVVSAGLEHWQKQAELAGASVSDLRRFTEPRLAEKLGVSYFRLPPVAPDNLNRKNDVSPIPLVGARFPTWLQCTQCDTIKPFRRWGQDPGDPSRYCSKCSHERPGNEKVFVVPVRFIVACRNGHLDDFPWAWWVHYGSRSCANSNQFRLRSQGAGLAGLRLECEKCASSRSLETIFKPGVLKGYSCSGHRPWIGPDADESCDINPQTLQRGASNLYFAQIESALVIPPWSEKLMIKIGHRWNDLVAIDDRNQRHQFIDLLVFGELSEYDQKIGPDEFKRLVDEKIEQSQSSTSGHIRWDEYQQFRISEGRTGRPGEDFEIRRVPVPEELSCLGTLQRVVSLREIRVLKGFTRIEPDPGTTIPVRTQPLDRTARDWLPAVEVRGEGVYVGLDEHRLAEWEARPDVLERAKRVRLLEHSAVLNPDTERDIKIGPALAARYLLVHSLAHILMKQLSLQCGYSTASLRERLYVGADNYDMAGVLIYTATPDADGTLGGLQRQGEPRRFEGTFLEALRSNEWCSSDPLCIKGLVSATESSNLGACHSCLLAPETSCEDFNRFLDRGMLLGTPEDRTIGFFSGLLDIAR